MGQDAFAKPPTTSGQDTAARIGERREAIYMLDTGGE
jgi:hypothetical protein